MWANQSQGKIIKNLEANPTLMTPMLCLVGRDSLHITDASTVRCDTLQPRDKAAWHARCADCLSGMCARARVKLKIETGMHRVCKEQRGAPDQLSQAWLEKLFLRNQEVPWVGDVTNQFLLLSLFSVWSFFRENLNMEVEIKETFESFIGLIPPVSAEYQMLKLVVLPSQM